MPHRSAYEGSRATFINNTLHVRLESLIPNNDSLNGNCSSRELQNQFIGQQLRNRCIEVADVNSFQAQDRYTKWGTAKEKRIPKKYDLKPERKEMLRWYSKDDLQFVVSQLDLNFERSIGYDYGYIYDIINGESNFLR